MKKLTVSNYLALAFIALVSTTTLKADLLDVNFQNYGSVGNQTGFDAIIVPGGSYNSDPQNDGIVTGTFGAYTVSVAGGASTTTDGTVPFLASGEYGGTPAGPYDGLYEGYFYAGGATDVRVEVAGLTKDTTYDVTLNSVNQFYPGYSYVRTLTSLDEALGTYVGTLTTIDTGFPGEPYPSALPPGTANGDGYYTLALTTDDNGDLFFADSLYDSSGNNTATALIINGFEVTTAPEPSTLGLMTLTGVLGLIWVARRKKLSV